MMVGEKRMNLQYMGQPQEADAIGYTCGWDLDTARTTDKGPKPDNIGESDSTSRFGSSHPGRFNAVLADGSVRSISDAVRPDVYKFLGSRAGGEVPGDF